MLARTSVVTALAAVFAALPARPARAQRSPECERCHASREFLLGAASDRNVGAGLVVTRAALSGGPHASVACAACHTGVERYPHQPAAALRVVCGRCHAEQDSRWRAGVHARARGDAPAATCVACHGGHDVARSGFLPTAAGRAHMREACRRCHPGQVRSAARDVHGDSIACTRCHGTHDMRPVPDEATRKIDLALARACSACHTKESATYWGDVHGRTAARQASGVEPIGADTAATCISCHGEHGIRRASDPTWRFASTLACTRCHEEYGSTFRDTYHGQAAALGSVRAAECADCHTAHAVFRTTDPASTVSAGNRIATCRHCHEGASGGFAGYRPHANPRSRAQNPGIFYIWFFMNVVLYGTMIGWGTHAALWYARTMIDRRRQPAAAHAAPAEPLDAALRGGPPYVWRFNLVFRVIHALIVASFYLLVLTGLPLRYSCTAWAPALARLLGGGILAGRIHRVAGVMVFGYFGLYAAYLAYRVWRARDKRGLLLGSESIAFRWQDARDAVAMVKWFFGRGPKPQFGRYSYLEKFDYFAELWGVGIISATGIVLWQPVFFARIFPGIVFNVAIIIHSYEAMIATAFIFIIHFFNVHLRPDKWPLDAVMFTGRASLRYMEEEHPLIAGALRAKVEGKEPSRRAIIDEAAPPPPGWMNMVAAVSGLLLLGVGLLLIGLVLWGTLC
ncbi:MAG: hypothetical protein Q8Q85_11305 [Gemmatimonadales bacterium]|nr:hypothetical protein [Gemmatimonadales bacterium]